MFEEHERLEHLDTEWCERIKITDVEKIIFKRRGFYAVDMRNG